jgi:DNA-binding transcriptional ArsR family regulator
MLGGTRGGPTRIRILTELIEAPQNANQLAKQVGMDYKTIQHHLRMMKKNRLVDTYGAGEYGATYFPSSELEQSLPEFDAIKAKMAAKPGKPS